MLLPCCEAASYPSPPGSSVTGLGKLCKENALCVALILRHPRARHGWAPPGRQGIEGCLEPIQANLTWLWSWCCQFRLFHVSYFWEPQRPPSSLPSPPIPEESPLQAASCAEHHLAPLVPI